MSDRKDRLEQYTQSRPPYPELQKRAAPVIVPKKEYCAFILYKGNERAERFLLYDHIGGIYGYAYSHLIEFSLQKGILQLITTTRSYTLTGKNLENLLDPLMGRKIRSLHSYNQETETLEITADEVVIERIERDDA